MENFIEKLENVQTLQESIGKPELKKLSIKLIEEYECEEELENNLLLFFSLNSSDIELVLKFMRSNSVERYDDKAGGKFLKNNERLISRMINKMNKIALKESNKPFHLAAALGELKISGKTSHSFNIDIKGLFENVNDNALKVIECPDGNYPRYVSMQSPWKLRMSFNTRTRQRKEDVGCHFEHGPFDGTIKGWASFSHHVVLMVLLQGWGLKLAANNNHFFYKWWFVIAVGLSPYSCQWLLFARKY